MRQGVHKFERSMCGLTFYRLYNKWYIRRNSSLTGRRVKTSKRFAKSRESAAKLGIASKLAASVYKPLPPAWKLYDLYKKLTALAIQLLHEGADEATIHKSLEQQLYDWGYRKEINYPVIKCGKKRIVLGRLEDCEDRECIKYKVQALKCSTSKLKSKNVTDVNSGEGFTQNSKDVRSKAALTFTQQTNTIKQLSRDTG
ncbi:MAG: hypothetical protein QM731_28130 [Chitinophagaceae bacterium]